MKDVDLTSDGHINKEWKAYWRSREGDPTLKRELRREKRLMKRNLNKKARKQTKRLLKEYLDND